jgi:glutamate dehydrogenase (NAD(P)+)
VLRSQRIADRFGGIDKSKARDLGYEILSGKTWIEQNVDILIPAALENQINRENVRLISPKVRLIAEGANGPTTPEADKAIQARGFFLVPNFLATPAASPAATSNRCKATQTTIVKKMRFWANWI